MAGSSKLKKLSPRDVRTRLSLGTMLVVAGLLVVLAGIGIGALVNMDRYGEHEGSPADVAAKVTDVEAVVANDDQGTATLNQERWHLVVEFQYGGSVHELTLEEYYVDETYANQCIGSMRELCVDTETFRELHERPVRWEFTAVIGIGAVILVAGLLVRFRYADYRRRILRSGAMPGEFVMQRGRSL